MGAKMYNFIDKVKELPQSIKYDINVNVNLNNATAVVLTTVAVGATLFGLKHGYPNTKS